MAESMQDRISRQVEASHWAILTADKSKIGVAESVAETRLAIAKSRSLIRSIEERREARGWQDQQIGRAPVG